MSQHMREHYMIVNRVILCNFYNYNKLTGPLGATENAIALCCNTKAQKDQKRSAKCWKMVICQS